MNKMKNTQNKTFSTSRKDFINSMNKKCYYCNYNNSGYCTKHKGKTSEAIGICSKELNDTYITYNDKAYKMPKSTKHPNASKKLGYEHYKSIRNNQLRAEQIKLCQACSYNKGGWCTSTKKWCADSMNDCNILIMLKKTYKLKKRKK